jgi:hypothetical protein
VTIRVEGHDYVALLDQWQSPPTVDEVEATLRRGLGPTVQAVGQVEIGARKSATTPPAPDRRSQSRSSRPRR